MTDIPSGILTDEGFTRESVKAHELSPYEKAQLAAPKPTTPSVTWQQAVARLTWVFASIVIAFQAQQGYANWELAESAPQQAAIAAWSCFQVIVPYTMARSLEGVLTA